MRFAGAGRWPERLALLTGGELVVKMGDHQYFDKRCGKVSKGLSSSVGQSRPLQHVAIRSINTACRRTRTRSVKRKVRYYVTKRLVIKFVPRRCCSFTNLRKICHSTRKQALLSSIYREARSSP